MKLVTFRRVGAPAEEVGVLRDAGYVMPARNAGFGWRTMNELILEASARDLAALDRSKGEALPPDAVELLSPIPRPLQDVLCLGLNYAEHAEEASQ